MLNPTALHDEISSCTISLQFSALSLPRKFLQTFSNAFQALFSVEFKFVLKSWSSNSCVICRPTEIPSFFLASLILGHFCLKCANHTLYLSIIFTDIFIEPSFINNGSKDFFTYPLKQDVPHSADPVLFPNGVDIVYSVVAVSRSAVPFTLKATEFCISALQYTLNCCNV
jgi:hypothetical protein